MPYYVVSRGQFNIAGAIRANSVDIQGIQIIVFVYGISDFILNRLPGNRTCGIAISASIPVVIAIYVVPATCLNVEEDNSIKIGSDCTMVNCYRSKLATIG